MITLTPQPVEIEFTRAKRKFKELPLTAMIDIVFILIFFFMLTTSFMRIESMELMLPSVSKVNAAKQDIARIVMYNDGTLSFGQRQVSHIELQETLRSLLGRNTEQQVVVYVDSEVSMQKLVDVMDVIALLGGKSLYVRPLPAVDEKPVGATP